MLSILVAESEIQTLQHLLKSTHKNNSKTRSTDCLFGVWCATLFNIAAQFKLNLSSIGDICVAGRGARVQITYQPVCFSCFHVPADHLGFLLTCTFWFISSARDLRSAFLTSSQLMGLLLVQWPHFQITVFYRTAVAGLTNRDEGSRVRCMGIFCSKSSS